jgi:hypothetical protein
MISLRVLVAGCLLAIASAAGFVPSGSSLAIVLAA